MNELEFEKLASTYTAIPVVRRFFADTITPVSLFLKIREGARYPILLESVEGGEQIARYSFLARDPYQILIKSDGHCLREDASGVRETVGGNFYDLLDSETRKYKEFSDHNLPNFTGGALGYSGYDMIREVENIPHAQKNSLNLPDAMWAFYDELYAFDHIKHEILLIKTVRLSEHDTDSKRKYAQAQIALDRMERLLRNHSIKSTTFSVVDSQVSSNFTLDEFTEIVEKGKRHIFEGDIFQVVLSQRFEQKVEGDSFLLYRALRNVNPSPYMYYLDFHEFQIIGSSPEVLVRVMDGQVLVLPIAGTRKRGIDRDEDLALEQELLADPKENAEHIMLVDLGRNDLARVCDPVSVKVQRQAYVVRYSHVMHIVSEVTGTLADDKTAVDALKWCFPAGTVSGAPKVRAMEIINQLEPEKRNVYAGAVGYLDFSGNMDTCIAIRTMVVKGDTVYVQAGAGIVSDSNPEMEYQETINKAQALISAIKTATTISDQIFS